MPTSLPIDERHPLCGTWYNHTQDTDDYALAEYSITAVDGQFHVTAVDRGDGEEFVISDVFWNGEWLTFTSFMPSTQRRVSQGGHDVPTEKLASRFPRTLANLKQVIRTLPAVLVFDNNDMAKPFRKIAEFQNGKPRVLAKPTPEWLDSLLRDA